MNCRIYKIIGKVSDQTFNNYFSYCQNSIWHENCTILKKLDRTDYFLLKMT